MPAKKLCFVQRRGSPVGERRRSLARADACAIEHEFVRAGEFGRTVREIHALLGLKEGRWLRAWRVFVDTHHDRIIAREEVDPEGARRLVLVLADA